MDDLAKQSPASAMLSPAQVARLTNLSRAAVYRAIDRGDLRASRLCGRLRVDPEELQAWKRRNAIGADREDPAPRLVGRSPGRSSSFLRELERMGQRQR